MAITDSIIVSISYRTNGGRPYQFTTSYPDFNAFMLHMRTLERAGVEDLNALGAEIGGFAVAFEHGAGYRRALPADRLYA